MHRAATGCRREGPVDSLWKLRWGARRSAPSGCTSAGTGGCGWPRPAPPGAAAARRRRPPQQRGPASGPGGSGRARCHLSPLGRAAKETWRRRPVVMASAARCSDTSCTVQCRRRCRLPRTQLLETACENSPSRSPSPIPSRLAAARPPAFAAAAAPCGLPRRADGGPSLSAAALGVRARLAPATALGLARSSSFGQVRERLQRHTVPGSTF